MLVIFKFVLIIEEKYFNGFENLKRIYMGI